MSTWEYKVVPAPTKGVKARDVKGPEARFAYALEILMNDMGAEGWEFQRAETLPSIERSGLTGTTTEWRNVMVFRRVSTEAIDEFERELLPAPDPLVEVEHDPAPAAASLQKRDMDETPTVVSHAVEETDDFEHVKSSVSLTAATPSEDGTKSPT